MTLLDPAWDQRLRESKLYKDPLAFVPLASAIALPFAFLWASSYELGRADRLGIPAGMVRVDLRSALVPLIWFMFMLYLVLPFAYQVQQLGWPRTLSAIAKRLRGGFFLLEVVVGITWLWQRESTPGVILGSLGFLYVLLYGIPWLLGWLLTRIRRPRSLLNGRGSVDVVGWVDLVVRAAG